MCFTQHLPDSRQKPHRCHTSGRMQGCPWDPSTSVHSTSTSAGHLRTSQRPRHCASLPVTRTPTGRPAGSKPLPGLKKTVEDTVLDLLSGYGWRSLIVVGWGFGHPFGFWCGAGLEQPSGPDVYKYLPGPSNRSPLATFKSTKASISETCWRVLVPIGPSSLKKDRKTGDWVCP